jgi:hypothetical protein
MSKQCVYAHDAADDYCKDCDGITVVQNGKSYPAETTCNGFLAEEPKLVAPPEETVAPATEAAPTPPSEVDDYVPQGITASIKAESGLSVELKDKHGATRWYKFQFSEERIIPETADMEKEKAALWNTVNREVDAQLEDVINFLNS